LFQPPDIVEALAAAGGLLTIDLAAIQHNYATLAAAVAPARCSAVVKADAYGLGAGQVAPALYRQGCRDFFVAHLGEALTLRPLLAADATIAILNGFQPGAEAACAGADLVPVLNSLDQYERWATEASRQRRRLPAILQLDSGMSRLGVPPDDLDALLAMHARQDGVALRLVMSHLACADEPDHPQNCRQRDTFHALLARVPDLQVSFANSGGILLGPGYHHDLARPGIALYGVNPDPAHPVPLKSVLTLDARVIQVRTIPAGTAVGYGASFVAAGPMRIATIAVGYADGWPRHLGNRGAAFFGAVRLPIVGRVSMDSITLDVTSLPNGALTLGSRVELIGPHQSLDDVARDADTIAYEILTRLGPRYARTYSDGPPA
jgi:alanine racemase